MKKHIYILGASGSGTTTLAKSLREKLGYVHFDSDDYLWIPTGPPFTTKRTQDEKKELLLKDIQQTDNWILSGDVNGYGDFLIDIYDLVIFLYIPFDLRMKRLVEREKQRFSVEKISPGGEMYETHKSFIEWAAAYETAGLEMRSLTSHNEILKQIKCPIIRIEGAQSNDERIEIVVREINKNNM